MADLEKALVPQGQRKFRLQRKRISPMSVERRVRVKLHEGNTVGQELDVGSPSVRFDGESDMI